MNLFIESLAEYLTCEWDRTLNAPDGPKEARFIVQSLDPVGTLALFEALDAHRQDWSGRISLVCYFRVARGLWDAWRTDAAAASTPGLTGAIQALEQHDWIDREDRLTWYRNRTVRDEQAAGIVTVLVGFNHATDQGGLEAFHRVDEHRLISLLKGSFQPWLQRIATRLGFSPSETELERFDAVLRQLFALRPLRLAKLADFLQPLIDQGNCYSLTEFRERCFKALPFWDIPPLLANGPAGVPNGSEAVKALKEADAFISHAGYKTKAGQDKDWTKIEKALSEPGFVPPVTADGKAVFADTKDYQGCLKSFIEEADPVARERLLRADFMPLQRALNRPEPGPRPKPTRKSMPAFQGMSFEALLQGIWDALLHFEAEECGDQPMWARLAGIEVRLESFHHDLSGDDTDGIGVKELAEDLLRGCLGGLEQRFAELDLRLPLNAEQAGRAPAYWERQVAVGLDLAIDRLAVNAVRGSARPYVKFWVSVADVDKALLELPYHWYVEATQPERVLHACAKRVLRAWNQLPHPERVLPAFRIDRVDLTALYFAADADEANRLVTAALGDLTLVDLRARLPNDQLAAELRESTKALIHAYRHWLDASLTHGYYQALFKELPALLQAFENLACLVLNADLLGAPELLRRLYKAFLLVDDKAVPNDPFLPAAVAWGLTPAVLELSLAQARFLADGFPEAVAELAIGGKLSGKAVFARLLDLSRIQRPVTALVTDATGHLSTKSRSFGLLHCLGEVPDTAKSLAVQSLLKEDESNDDEDVGLVIRPGEEQPVVVKVLELYQELHAYARDGLRILAVNVTELPTILAGVDTFLKQALKIEKGDTTAHDLPPFYCTLMVYSSSSSPLAMENGLALWRDRMVESHRENGRDLDLTVGHRFAPKDRMIVLLRQERRLYDVAFLFHFLRADMDGRVDPAFPFTLAQDGIGGYFPIAEYPRPIKSGDRDRRQMLLSNRRLRIQTRHSDLSARLRNAGHESADFVVYGQVDFAPWVDVIEGLHARSQWVACIDSFVDKRLLNSAPATTTTAPDLGRLRKIVGFESGLGAYGELNLTISTEQDTLGQLITRVAHELNGLLPFQQPVGFQALAERIVADAEEIIGLASLRAVLGQGEKLREVVGFAAIRRLLQAPPGCAMSQLLPLDALGHWLADADTELRPDLLQLTLEVRPNEPPCIHATVVECKLAGHNPVHEAKALAQVSQGLRHLSAQFAPRDVDGGRRSFDRRYWWAQLHRAIASRAVVTLADRDWRELDHALESLAEGRFEICWRAVLFTFWTNVPMPDLTVTSLTPTEPVTRSPIATPARFVIEQVQLGYQGLASLFAAVDPETSFVPSGVAICLRPKKAATQQLASEDEAEPGGLNFSGTPVDDSPHVSQPAGDAQSTGDPTFATAVGEAKAVDESSPTPGQESPTSIGTETGQADIDSGPLPAGAPARFVTGASAQATPDTSQPAPVHEATVASAFPVPERILIGTRTNGEPVYWHFGHPKLQNRHLLIFGTSGSGKTYGIQCLLAEMASAGLCSLIVDYTDGFLPGQVEPRFQAVAQPQDHFVYTERLPLNPFRRQRQVIDPLKPAVEEGSFQVAARIESIFASVFAMGDQQSAALIRSLQAGLDLDPGFSLDKLLPRLREDSPQGETLANKLEPLIQAKPFREGVESEWNGMLTSADNQVHVLQLKGLAREIQKLVTEFVLWDLWDYAQSTGQKDRPIPIVLDEIQNLDHSSDSPIDKMLREGRKFGVALILATQTTSQFNQEQRDRLFQAGHKLFFKPATTEIDRFAQILAQATAGTSKPEWTQRLAKLEKGHCWSLGPVLRPDGSLKEDAVLVSVTPLEHRLFGG